MTGCDRSVHLKAALLATLIAAATNAAADPLTLTPPSSTGGTTTWSATGQMGSTTMDWFGVEGQLEQRPLGGSDSESFAGTGGLDFRGQPGGASDSLIQRWPGVEVVPPLHLSDEPILAELPGLPDGPIGHPGTPRSMFPAGGATGGGYSDPGLTPPPMVPLPAAGWAALSALPLVAGAGWVRRRRMGR